MKLVLVRHGETTGNREQVFTGWSDVSLTDKGIEELKTFKELYDYPETDRYYSSDLKRAVDTFEILFGDKHTLYKKEAELREIYFGELENKGEVHHFELFSEKWIQNIREYNWETPSEFTYRIVSAVEQILKDMKENKEDSVTIVCHGGVIRTLIMFLTHRPYADFDEVPTPNGLGYVLDLDYDDEKGRILINHYYPIKKKAKE